MRIFFIFTFSIAFVLCEPLLSSIAGKLNKIIFVYPKNIQSERDLFVCPENSACNIIHKRYWLPPIIERICKCPQRQDCNWTWSEKPDNHTMTINNRSQMKFCEEIKLPKCTLKKPALRVTLQNPNKDLNTTAAAPTHRNAQKTNRHTQHKNVTAFCNCQEPHYWKLKLNSTKYDEETDRMHQLYFCSKLKKCTKLEFCGHLRKDTHSTFYRCSCPKGHLCITQDKSVFGVEEVLFSGFGYKAFCLPVEN